MGFEEDLARTLERTAVHLQAQTGPIREQELEDALVASYRAEAIPRSSIARQVPLSLKGFQGVGNCDVGVSLDDEGLPILLELKWGVGKLYNCAWDAVKLALALCEKAASEAYLIAGAPLTDWESAQRGSELFSSQEWGTSDFIAFYAKEFAFWRSDVKTRPEILPERFAVSKVSQADLKVAGAGWSLRSSRVSMQGSGVVSVDENGSVNQLPS
jgi:hypothetical protein